MGFKIVSPKAVLPLSGYMAAHAAGKVAAFGGRYFVDRERARFLSEPMMVRQMLNNLASFGDGKASVAAAIGKGRMCVVGEHNDHELGPTVSFPMDNGTLCTGMLGSSGRQPGRISFLNMDDRFGEMITALHDLSVKKTTMPPWFYYPAACLIELMKKYPQVTQLLEQRELVLQFNGLPPLGIPAKGLSSSAAIEMATLITLVNLLRNVLPPDISRSVIAELGVAAENSFANCGRLDQHTSIAPEGRQGVLLDHWHMARGNWDQAYRFFDMPEQLLFGIADSGVAASTASAGYRVRRLSGWVFAAMFFDRIIGENGKFSQAAREFIQADALSAAAPSLRDVSDFLAAQCRGKDLWDEIKAQYFPAKAYAGAQLLEMLAGFKNFAPSAKLLFEAGLKEEEVVKMGALFKPKYGDYILEEIARVRQLFKLMSEGKLAETGPILGRTHYGMSEIYEAGTPQNWNIFEMLTDVDGVIGGRIVGAGFGGANMFAILEETPILREAVFEAAKKALAKHGFSNVHMVPTGNGSAVVEIE